MDAAIAVLIALLVVRVVSEVTISASPFVPLGAGALGVGLLLLLWRGSAIARRLGSILVMVGVMLLAMIVGFLVIFAAAWGSGP